MDAKRNMLTFVLFMVVIAASTALATAQSAANRLSAWAGPWVSSYDEVIEQYIGVYPEHDVDPEATVVFELTAGNHRLGLLKAKWDASYRLVPICATQNEQEQWRTCGGGGIGTVGVYGPEDAPYDFSLSWTAFRLPLSHAPYSRPPQLVIGLYGFVREGVPIRRIELITASGETHHIHIFEDGLPFFHLYAAETLGGHEAVKSKPLRCERQCHRSGRAKSRSLFMGGFGWGKSKGASSMSQPPCAPGMSAETEG